MEARGTEKDVPAEPRLSAPFARVSLANGKTGPTAPYVLAL